MRPTERTFYLGVIAVLLLLLFLVRTCDKPAKCNKAHCEDQVKTSVILIKRDTIEVEKKDSTEWHKPQQQVLSLLEAKSGLKKTEVDSFAEVSKSINRDSMAVADYFNIRDYSDTNIVEGGEVIVENKVYMNRLALQRVITNIKQKTITEEKVVTNTVKEEQRGQLYAGLIAQGQKTDPLTSFGGQFIWKTKKENMWTGSVLLSKGGQVIYQAGHLWKISFK